MANADDNKAPELDPFILDALFPDTQAYLAFEPKSIAAIKGTAMVFLDTNVLLVPYGTGRDSLQTIENVYSQLLKEKRLSIPRRVIQEFARNRPLKLKVLYQQLSQQRAISVPKALYPLLEGIDAYRKLTEAEQAVEQTIRDYRKAVAETLQVISDWSSDDPVLQIYRRLFKAADICTPAIDKKALYADLRWRNLHKIPPGYKDSAKDDEGIGDLLIWHSILAEGNAKKKDAIFVTNEEKSDWWHRSDNAPLYLRQELQEEYSRASGGRSLHCVQFAKLLELFGASAKVIEEVQAQEIIAATIVKTDEEAEAKRRGAALEACQAWIRTQHPGADVNLKWNTDTKDFDYVVNANGMQLGYEWTYLENPDLIPYRLERELRDAIRSLQSGFSSYTIVFTVPSATATKAAASLRTAEIPAKLPISLVLGAISPEGTFSEFFRAPAR